MNISNADVSFNETSENMTAHYTCQEKFVASDPDNMSVKCLQNSSWSVMSGYCVGQSKSLFKMSYIYNVRS